MKPSFPAFYLCELDQVTYLLLRLSFLFTFHVVVIGFLDVRYASIKIFTQDLKFQLLSGKAADSFGKR